MQSPDPTHTSGPAEVWAQPFSDAGTARRTGTGGRRDRRRVWSWWERDPISLTELACVIAVDSRRQLRAARRRLGFEGAVEEAPVGAIQPEFAAAMQRPGSFLWMPLDRYASRSPVWFGEDQLTAMRAASASRPCSNPSGDSAGRLPPPPPQLLGPRTARYPQEEELPVPAAPVTLQPEPVALADVPGRHIHAGSHRAHAGNRLRVIDGVVGLRCDPLAGGQSIPRQEPPPYRAAFGQPSPIRGREASTMPE
jgi:hypothetical protein